MVRQGTAAVRQREPQVEHPSGQGDRPAPERRRQRRWVPLSAGLLCFLIGALDIGSTLTPELYARAHELARVFPGVFSSAATAATMVTGTLLLLLSHALRRRKRRAWRAVVVLLALSIVFHLVKDLDIAEALVAAFLLAALVHYRDEFYAVGDPRTRWRALGVFLLLVAVSVGIGTALLSVRSGSLVGHYTLGQRFTHVFLGLVGFSGPVRFRSDRMADAVSFSLDALGWLTVLTTTYLVLRPPEPRASLDRKDEWRMRALLVRYGARDSLGYFALRRDKSVIWSPTGKSCIAYRVVSGVMLASGDPLGDPEAWPGAIREFLEEAARHAWVPAVLGCGERGGEVWTRVGGLDALEVGDEAVVDVAGFCLGGRTMRNVRQMVARVERQGYTACARRARDIPADELEVLRAESDSWRGAEVERGFSMALGRLGDPGDGDCVVVTAARDGAVRALLHFVPWGEDGLSLDIMRRDRTAAPGLNELLIVTALRAAPSLGVRRLSLNFAVFRAALERGERLGAGPVLRAWRGVLVFLSRWFQIESLYRFNAKFGPVWEPRFLVYPSTRDIPRIAVAALEAEAFIVWPELRWVRRLLPGGR